jgi:hypothetical protein
MKEIVIEIDKETGEIKLETLGFKGKSCIEGSKWIKELIGREIEQQLTPAYFLKEKDKEHRVKYLPLCGMWVLIFILFTSMGCVNKRIWYKENTTSIQFQKDLNECKYNATLYGYVPKQQNYYRSYGVAMVNGFSHGIEQETRNSNIIKECMEQKGYHQ